MVNNDIISKIREREKDIQMQWEDVKIRKARYNNKYKKIDRGRGKPDHLRLAEYDRDSFGDEIRALIKERCGNMEENNKYWKEENKKICKFCNIRIDSIDHYVKECRESKGWFQDVGKNEEKQQKISNDKLDENKEKGLVKLWKEKVKMKGKEGKKYKKQEQERNKYG